MLKKMLIFLTIFVATGVLRETNQETMFQGVTYGECNCGMCEYVGNGACMDYGDFLRIYEVKLICEVNK